MVKSCSRRIVNGEKLQRSEDCKCGRVVVGGL